jgi:hypothetical protein
MVPGRPESSGKESSSLIRSGRRVESCAHSRGGVTGQRGNRLVEPDCLVLAGHLLERRGDRRICGRVEKGGRRRCRAARAELLNGSEVADRVAGLVKHRR